MLASLYGPILRVYWTFWWTINSLWKIFPDEWFEMRKRRADKACTILNDYPISRIDDVPRWIRRKFRATANDLRKTHDK